MELKLEHGRPGTASERSDRECRVYDLLERLDIDFWRVDHGAARTMTDCAEADSLLGEDTAICKNLFLCNAKKTEFYLLMMPGEKKFLTKDLSRQIGSTRLSFAGPEYLEKYLDIQPGAVSVMGLMNDVENHVSLVIDRDVFNHPYVGCHPCESTSSLKIACRDLMEKFLPAVHHEARLVTL